MRDSPRTADAGRRLFAVRCQTVGSAEHQPRSGDHHEQRRDDIDSRDAVRGHTLPDEYAVDNSDQGIENQP